MRAYRYNTLKREDRKFNTTGIEKNPLNIKFYASSLEAAEAYRFVYFGDGDVNYECELEEVEIEANLFDMCSNFASLSTFDIWVNDQIEAQLKDYRQFLTDAKTKKEQKRWSVIIEDTVKNRKSELITMLNQVNFQYLSDFSYQPILVAELKALVFNGYKTCKEIAIF